MAADATLVQAALKEAQSRVPLSTPRPSPEKVASGLMNPIMKVMEEKRIAKDSKTKEKNKADDELKDAQIAEFTKTADAINRRLSTYERGGKEAGMHEQIYNNTFDYLDELKGEFETYNTTGDEDTPENKKKRIEILGKLDAVKNSTVQLRADVLEIGKLAGSKDGGSQMSKHGMSKVDIAITNEILNMDGDYSNVQQRWEDNEIVFDVTIPDEIFNSLSPEEQKLGNKRTWKASDIKNNFVKIPKEMEAGLLAQSGNAETSGKRSKAGDKFDLQLDIDANMEIIGNDKKAASHIFQTRQTGQPSKGWDVPGGTSGKWEPGSWANALEAHPDLNGEPYRLDLEEKKEVIDDLIFSGKLIYDDVDTDGGGISPEEYEAVMDSENRDLVIDVYVNSRNPLYEHKRSVEEFATWRAKQNEAKFYENQPKPPPGDFEITPETSSNWSPSLDINPGDPDYVNPTVNMSWDEKLNYYRNLSK